MLELGQKPAVPAGGDLIRDVNEAQFMTEVIDRSMTVPVVVDFWAPWCGPCKTLGPQLEAAVTAAKGKVAMAKVNVDENPGISGQLRIQSIPTVYAFWQGKPVDGFQGAISGSEVKAFVDKLAGLAGDGGLADAIQAAEDMLAEGAAADAAETFAAILEEEPDNAKAYGGLVRSHLAIGNLDQAEGLLSAAPEKIARSQEVETARAQLDLARQAANAGPLDQLQAKVAADPADMQARFDLALAQHAAGQVEAAIDTLLDIMRRDRDWNEGAAKAQLLTIFEALKPNDPVVLKGRRKLASILLS
jgi:putative thioredoxin